MKNLIKKVRHHGKKITIYLKSQPKWIARCMFGIGAVFGLVLSLHAHTIGGTNAQSIECPEGQYLATGDVCITNEKDIVIQATATEENQRLTINKYFDNDYTVDRGDGTTGNLTEDSTHTYENAGIYNVILSLSGGTDRWTFTGEHKPLVPKLNTTVTGVVIRYMPSLAKGFGDTMANPGNRFFACFNRAGALTSLPEGSFDISNITTVGDDFFSYFNRDGALTSLPEGSFDISNITTVGDDFFSEFNYNFHFNGALTSLPEGSFILSTGLTTVGDNFFAGFVGALTSLPNGSFDISNITTVGDDFFSYFGGALTSLPDGSFDISNITTVGNDFFFNFVGGKLISLPEGSFILSTGLTTVGDDFFSHFVGGALTSLPEGSFDLSNITTVGDNFFSEFNYYSGALTSLPIGSFDISNIATVGDNFFSSFVGGSLTSLPEGSFILSTGLTTVGGGFFSSFVGGALTSLPDGSFDLSNITTVGDNFFSEFNYYSGVLTSLPTGSFDISNITTVGDGFFSSFNQGGALTSLPDGSFILSTGLTTVGDNFFSNFNGGLEEGSALTSLPTGSFDTSNITSVGDHFFSYFNSKGALTSLPTGSFDTSNITSVGNYFFNFFNASCSMTSLPDGSFRLSTGLTTVGNSFFGSFNTFGKLTSLPTGSFDTSHITSVGNFFFNDFNAGGALTSLPDGSFDLSNIATVSDRFFSYFNSNGALTHLPDSFTLNSTGSQSVSGYMNAFYSPNYTLNKRVSDLVTGVMVPGTDRNTFSNNQPGRCGVHENWLGTKVNACSISYNNRMGGEGLFRYDADTTGVVAGSGMPVPTANGYTFEGRYTVSGVKVDVVIFPDMDGQTLYGRRIASGNNATYLDIEGNEFRWNDLTICNPSDSGNCITIMDRNLGATTNDISKTGSYGYHYQWGNNYGFNARSLNSKVGQVDASGYGPNNPYNSGVFLYGYTNRNSGGNDNLWGGSGDSQSNHRGWDNRYSTAERRQGPCPQGYHVPSIGERNQLFYYWYNSLDTKYGVLHDNYSLYQLTDQEGRMGRMINEYFYIPTAGNITTNRWQPNGTQDLIPRLIGLVSTGTTAEIWSSTPFGMYNEGDSHDHIRAFSVNFLSGYGTTISAGTYGIGGSEGLPVRCFKNSPNTGHNSPNNGISFSISIDDTIKVGENTDFVVKIMKAGATFKGYAGTVYFELTDKKGNAIDRDLYEFSEGKHYKFNESDRGRKTFSLKIKREGTYVLKLYDSDNENIEGSEIITVKSNGSSSSFEYDTYKFNPNYSDEMNKAYQYARYYNITTIDSIKDAGMGTGLNRIAMAKMLANYAVNVLGRDDFNTSRNCTFKDVSTSLDRNYDYGVTKACQLGIMGINMPDNKFYPKAGVTRAEFATALSRLLYGTKDGADRYYSTHITKLYNERIISNTDPKLREKRGYVMLMLMRASK